MKEALALQVTKMPLKKPKISYNTIRKNTSLDGFMVKEPEECKEEVEPNPE